MWLPSPRPTSKKPPLLVWPGAVAERVRSSVKASPARGADGMEGNWFAGPVQPHLVPGLHRAISVAQPPAPGPVVLVIQHAQIKHRRPSGLSQRAQDLTLVPVAIAITDPVLHELGDRMDGVELLTEALADTRETGRFRELARFFERAFGAPPAGLIRPLADFLRYYDKLQYTYDEVEQWRQLRHQATHADHRDRRYVLARDVRPALIRVELAAYDVLFNKRDWSQPDSDRREVWRPAGGVLRDQRQVVIRTHASVRLEADPMMDGFGAYPYDRSCKIGSYPRDWWLDTVCRAKTLRRA
jgi:hypothetical protein